MAFYRYLPSEYNQQYSKTSLEVFVLLHLCLLCQFRIAHNDRNITVIIGGTRVGFLHRLIGNLPLIEFALNAKPNTILFRNNINTMVAGTRSHLCLGKTFFQQTVCTVTLKSPNRSSKKKSMIDLPNR